MTLLRYLRAMVLFARFQPWVDEPKWEKADAEALARYLGSPSGSKFKEQLLNLVLRQAQSATGKTSNLKYEAGFASGQRAAVAAITALAETYQLTEQGEEDADHAAN